MTKSPQEETNPFRHPPLQILLARVWPFFSRAMPKIFKDAIGANLTGNFVWHGILSWICERLCFWTNV